MVQIYLRTAVTLPSTSRRVPVIDSREILQNPLEVAIQTVAEKNADLTKRIDAAQQLTVRSTPQSFSMAIKGAACPAVNGGLAKNYHPFLNGSYATDHPEIEEDLVLHPEKRLLLGVSRFLVCLSKRDWTANK